MATPSFVVELLVTPSRAIFLSPASFVMPALVIRVRIDALLKHWKNAKTDPDAKREQRAMRALERIGTPAAMKLLEELAAGVSRWAEADWRAMIRDRDRVRRFSRRQPTWMLPAPASDVFVLCLSVCYIGNLAREPLILLLETLP